jgi:hypothetical protein
MSEFPSKRVAAYKGFKWPSRRYHFERNTVLTSLTVTEYLCHRWPRIYSVCRSNNPVISLLMKCHLRLNNINTTGNTSGAEATYYSGSNEFTLGFFWCESCGLIFIFVWCFVDQCLSFSLFVFSTFCLLSMRRSKTFSYPLTNITRWWHEISHFTKYLFFSFCVVLLCVYVLDSVLWWPLRFPHQNDVQFVFLSSCL